MAKNKLSYKHKIILLIEITLFIVLICFTLLPASKEILNNIANNVNNNLEVESPKISYLGEVGVRMSTDPLICRQNGKVITSDIKYSIDYNKISDFEAFDDFAINSSDGSIECLPNTNGDYIIPINAKHNDKTSSININLSILNNILIFPANTPSTIFAPINTEISTPNLNVVDYIENKSINNPSFTIYPELPIGFELDENSGVISGHSTTLFNNSLHQLKCVDLTHPNRVGAEKLINLNTIKCVNIDDLVVSTSSSSIVAPNLNIFKFVDDTFTTPQLYASIPVLSNLNVSASTTYSIDPNIESDYPEIHFDESTGVISGSSSNEIVDKDYEIIAHYTYTYGQNIEEYTDLNNVVEMTATIPVNLEYVNNKTISITNEINNIPDPWTSEENYIKQMRSSSIPTTNVLTVEDEGSFDVSSSTTFSVSPSLPSGLTINANSGEISGTANGPTPYHSIRRENPDNLYTVVATYRIWNTKNTTYLDVLNTDKKIFIDLYDAPPTATQPTDIEPNTSNTTFMTQVTDTKRYLFNSGMVAPEPPIAPSNLVQDDNGNTITTKCKFWLSDFSSGNASDWGISAPYLADNWSGAPSYGSIQHSQTSGRIGAVKYKYNIYYQWAGFNSTTGETNIVEFHEIVDAYKRNYHSFTNGGAMDPVWRITPPSTIDLTTATVGDYLYDELKVKSNNYGYDLVNYYDIYGDGSEVVTIDADYSISPALPPELTFDTLTGRIKYDSLLSSLPSTTYTITCKMYCHTSNTQILTTSLTLQA